MKEYITLIGITDTHLDITDSDIWNQFVETHPNGHLLQCWEWGALKKEFGWQVERIGITGDAQHVVAGAQVLFKKIPKLPYSLAYIPKGPVVDWNNENEIKKLLEAIHMVCRKKHAILLTMEPDMASDNPGTDHLSSRLQSLGFKPSNDYIQPLRTIIVDLTADEQVLKERQKPKWRYNTGLAARKGVQVREAGSYGDVDAWYQVMIQTSQRDQFGVHSLQYYQKIWELFREGNKGKLFLAELEGKLLAGIFVGILGNMAIYLYGASSNEYRNYMPNHLLQWHAMLWAKEKGAAKYDLWGIPNTDQKDEDMAGVYRFKMGWGGEIVQFTGAYDYNYMLGASQALAVLRSMKRSKFSTLLGM